MKQKSFRLNPAEEKAASIYEQKTLLDGSCSDKEEKIRQRYANSCPIEEIQRYIIKTSNVLAISVISEMWDFDAEVVKSLIRKATAEAREAYTANRKFIKALEPEYAKSCLLPELCVYFSRYKKEMNKKAYNICVDVRKIDPSPTCCKETKTDKIFSKKVEGSVSFSTVKDEQLIQPQPIDGIKEKAQKPFGQFGKDGIFYM